MKKFLLIALFGIYFLSLITGCKKEADTTTPASETPAIVGKWSYKNDLVSFYTKGNVKSSPFTYINAEFIQFNKDGSGNDDNTTFTYTVKNNQLIISYAAYTSGGITYDAETSTSELKSYHLIS